MYREEDGCIVEWRKMERRRLRRMEGKERSSRVMDGWVEGVLWLRCRGMEGKRVSCPICSIIIQCVSVWLGKEIIKETRGRPGSLSRWGSTILSPFLPLNLYNFPPFQVFWNEPVWPLMWRSQKIASRWNGWLRDSLPVCGRSIAWRGDADDDSGRWLHFGGVV